MKIDKSISVNIPKGVQESEKIVIMGEGHQNLEGKCGDLLVQLVYKKHHTFVKIENDLKLTIKIGLKESLLGIRYSLDHLDDSEIVIDIRGPIRHGSTRKLVGYGMPIKNREINGDLYLKISVEYPKILSEEQKKNYQRKFLNIIHFFVNDFWQRFS